MQTYLIRKLAHGAALSENDRALLKHLARCTRNVEPHKPLVSEGDPVQRVFVMLRGWACRSKLLPGGQRLITDLILPGDISHVQTNLLGYADHSVVALTRGVVAEIDPLEIPDAIERSPGIARAVRWSSLQTDSILRQALINNGRRLSAPRIAHVICEVQARLLAVGVPVEDGFAWPLKQDELADVTGMTAVHVNRSLKTLRDEGLILLQQRRMLVPDAERLAAFCAFTPDYLHFTYASADERRPQLRAIALETERL
ncbi:Crp/Fnr family transcriptional regulator [Methylobacterium sp. E-005]|uniref:Crp/Fnr family transcriptional regulator n=1 Tax=Methylobacterium sp. E-005 TaxID=2836549 RepID=UPI001FB8F1AF|nr:Crp/Fnr family transcriptional regulator [Methylobacterium sp. E-005]MCJ2090796.1 Crp/Fnr family transcriptional regulator [Methylobacterium sp. E-005]